MLKNISKGLTGVVLLLALSAVFSLRYSSPVTADSNTTFQVNVKEVLAVSITTPDSSSWAAGDIDTLLRNKVTISVTSNNASGFVVGLNAGNTTSTLTNTTKNSATLPTLTADWTRSSSSSVTNFWGYSTNDDGEKGTYHQVPTSSSTPATLFNSGSGTSKDVYFGAKASIAQASGTYAGTIIITAISGTTTIATPSDPATPNPTNEATYTDAPTGGSNGTTTYTYSHTSNNVTTTTTQVSDGDYSSAYSSYNHPQGEVYNTASNISSGSSIATGLAVTAAVTATSGIVFFVIAKRREDDDEEDDEY